MGNGPDWGDGHYERFAPELVPAAEHLVELASPQKGERAVDLGCGSGNATVLLAATGAQVTAVDPSLRLLGIAAQRVRDEGLRITTSLGGAEQLPLPDNDADVVISNFGVIFSTDLEASLSEALRVLTAQGRFLYSAWVPTGPISAIRDLILAASGGRAPVVAGKVPLDGTARMLWHEPSSFAHLIPGGESAITVHHAQVDFHAESPEAWIAAMESDHPAWMAARSAIADEAAWRRAMDQGTQLLAEQSKATDRLVVASDYIVVEIHPQR